MATDDPTTGNSKRGFVIPTEADFKKAVARLKRELPANPKLAQAFRRNPRGVLGAMGLFEDAQRQLLLEANLRSNICWFTCAVTCYCGTDACCLTQIIINS